VRRFGTFPDRIAELLSSIGRLAAVKSSPTGYVPRSTNFAVVLAVESVLRVFGEAGGFGAGYAWITVRHQCGDKTTAWAYRVWERDQELEQPEKSYSLAN